MIVNILFHESGHLWKGWCEKCGEEVEAIQDGFGHHRCADYHSKDGEVRQIVSITDPDARPIRYRVIA